MEKENENQEEEKMLNENTENIGEIQEKDIPEEIEVKEENNKKEQIMEATENEESIQEEKIEEKEIIKAEKKQTTAHGIYSFLYL